MRRNILSWFILGGMMAGVATVIVATAYGAVLAGMPPVAVVGVMLTTVWVFGGIYALSRGPARERPPSHELRCREAKAVDARRRERSVDRRAAPRFAGQLRVSA